MASLTDLPELVGFFSYSRRDDLHSQGALSRLRTQIHNELRLQLGFDFRLWQDTAAIPDGALWEGEIKRAIAEAVFFIPIVTPGSVGSKHCRLEFEAFLDRERALDRNNLIFPILYVGVPGLEKEELWRHDPLLSIIGTRQYIDWQKFRHRGFAEAEIAEKIEQYCSNIVRTLRQPWNSPEERRVAQEAEAQRIAELEQRRIEEEAATRQRTEAEKREREAAEAARRREAETRAREKAQAERLAAEAEKWQRAEGEERERKIAEAARREEEVSRRQAEAKALEKSDRKKSAAELQATEKAPVPELAPARATPSAEEVPGSPDTKEKTPGRSKTRRRAGVIIVIAAAMLLGGALYYYLGLDINVATNIDVPGCTMFRKIERVTGENAAILAADNPRGKSALQLATEAELAARQRGLNVDRELFNDRIDSNEVRNDDTVIICGPRNSALESEITKLNFVPVIR